MFTNIPEDAAHPRGYLSYGVCGSRKCSDNAKSKDHLVM